MEDQLLVFQCKRGSREALTRIYEKYRTDLLLLAMGLLNDKAAAEDIVHDVFVSFVRSLDGFRLTGSLKGFLLTCTANHARNWNKAQRVRGAGGRVGCARQPPSLAEEDGGQCPPYESSESDTDQSPLETLVCNEQLAMLSQAMAELPFEQREVVMLHLHGQMTFQAIARAGQISTNTAKSRYRYGMDKLRSILNGRISKCDQQMT
jgi:RNA polymerase sigma factor (sigma-70 family)